MLRYTSDIGNDFFPKLEVIATRLRASSLDMLSVMFSESSCRATAHNDNPKTLPPEKRWNASGLIQFMPATLAKLGWTKGHAAFRQLTATEQLPWVERYYSPYVQHLGTVAGLYLATFLPALIRHATEPNFVLTAKGGPLGWAYTPNASLDANGDLAITVNELELAVHRNCAGPRFDELVLRLRNEPIPVPPTPVFDLRTVRGIQQALQYLDFAPGEIDGLYGPKTSSAVMRFQRTHRLTADGIVGPKTRAGLETAVRLGA